MDRLTYAAQQALKSFDTAERAMTAARKRLDDALEEWHRTRPGTMNHPAPRDIEDTLRMALRLTGELPVDIEKGERE